MEPSTFHNREPRSREERIASSSKHGKEATIKQTHGLPANPITINPNSPLYASEEDRFNREVAASIKHEKEQKMQSKQELYERKRAEQYEREKARWDHMAAEQQTAEAKLKAKRDNGIGAISNKSSEHFNIISLSYNPTAEGSKLQQKDEASRYRASVRTEMLHQKASSVPHNIITGEMRPSPAEIMARSAATGSPRG